LTGELSVKVEFILEEALADQLLGKLHNQKLKVFYVQSPVQTGTT